MILCHYQVNEGWVKSNYMKDKASNTTRDYLRVSIFLAGNAIILSTVLAGFATQTLSQSWKTPYQKLMIAKLGMLFSFILPLFNLYSYCQLQGLAVVFFLAIFYLFFSATRFAVHAQYV